MFQFRTEGFNGSAVKYSPFFDNRLAVAASSNFGLVGNGRLFILELTPNGIAPSKLYVEPRYPANPAIRLSSGWLLVFSSFVHG
jgi:hypothetical protein